VLSRSVRYIHVQNKLKLTLPPVPALKTVMFSIVVYPNIELLLPSSIPFVRVAACRHDRCAGDRNVPEQDIHTYGGADKSLARPTSRCILFDGGNISFDASLFIYIYIVLIFPQL